MGKIKLLRITTVPISLATLLKGQLAFMAKQNFDVLAVSADGPEIEQLKSDGIAHVTINMTRKITPLQDLIALWKLILLIRKFKPAIVHTHTPKAGLVGMLAAWICRVPVRLHTVAGLAWIETTGVRRSLLKRMEWLTYACATRVYPNSKALRNFLLMEMRFNPDHVKVIGSGSSNGIDCRIFTRSAVSEDPIQAIRNQHGIKPGDMVFCFVGRIVRDKGIVELVSAFERLVNEQPCWLLLVGHREPDLDPLPAETLQIINNSPAIIEAGFQTDVRPWLAASQVFVFPSYREGFPNVVMQAACLELPCIVSDINGCNEIIQHGHSGLIIPVKDIDSLYAAMKQLAGDSILRTAMGKAGAAFVSANFDQQVVWKELLKEYVGFPAVAVKFSPQRRKGAEVH
jgi:glycosyltransferase involved in cell wall biosynthesis